MVTYWMVRLTTPPRLGYNHCYVIPGIKLHCEFYGNRITFLSTPALRHFFGQQSAARHLGDIFLGTTAGAPPGRHFFDDFAHDAVDNIGTTAVTPIYKSPGSQRGKAVLVGADIPPLTDI